MNQQEWHWGDGNEYAPDLVTAIHRARVPLRQQLWTIQNRLDRVARTMRSDYGQEVDCPYQDAVDQLFDLASDAFHQFDLMASQIDALPSCFLGFTESVMKQAVKTIQKARREERKRAAILKGGSDV